MKITLSKYIIEKFKEYENKEYLIFKNNRYTYKEIDKMSTIYAKGLLALGMKPKEHLAIVAQNSDEWVLIQLACIKIGVVLVMLNNDCREKELKHMINHSDSTYLITTKEICKRNNLIDLNIKTYYIEELREILIKNSLKTTNSYLESCINRTGTPDVISIQYTSGTTGLPKGVLIKEDAVLRNILDISKNYKYTSNDKIVLASPLYHVMGSIVTTLVALTQGSSVVLLEKFKTKEVLNLIEKERATVFHGVPTMYQYMLLEHKNYDISSLKKGLIGAANCKTLIKKQIMEELKIEHLLNVYGQTETLLVCQVLQEHSLDKKLNTCGKPFKDVEIKIINPITKEELPPNEEGELIVKTPTIMKGYYKDTEQTNKTIVDGWVHTGDVAIKDSDGYIIIKNRIKEIIIRGGENISPLEIEEVMIKHDLVKDISIVGVNDFFLGEEIAALVILKDNEIDKEVAKSTLLEYLSSNISKFKIPKYIEFVDTFHTTGSGKIQKYKQKEFIEKKYNLQ